MIAKAVSCVTSNFIKNAGHKDIVNNPHYYEGVTEEMSVFTFNDAYQGLNMKTIYSKITEGFDVNPKGKKEYVIPYHLSPKILITSNFWGERQGRLDSSPIDLLPIFGLLPL